MPRASRCRTVLAGGLLAAMLGGCATPAPRPGGPVEVVGTYRHPSGMEFPPQVGELSRTGVQVFPAAADDVGVSYELGAEPLAVVTAYVYRAPAQSLERQFEAVIAEVSGAHNRRAPAERRDVVVTQAGGPITGKLAVWELDNLWGRRTVPLRSRAYLFRRGPWFVKYRITNPVSEDARVSPAVTRLLEALAMPADV